VLLVVGVGPHAAMAQNCVDKHAAVRPPSARLCMDVGTSLGRVETWRAPGFLDVRVGIMRLGLYGNDGPRRGTGFELVTWETISPDGGDTLEGPRDFGPASALHALTLRRQVDHDAWGAFVAGDLVTRWFGDTRLVTPRLGVRLGRFDRAAIVLDARFAGAHVIGFGDAPRSFTRDVDLGAMATWVLTRRIRLEARGRYRDLTDIDDRQLRDVSGAVGLDLEASPPGPRPGPNTWRVMTLFVGVGARRALVDELGPPSALAPPARAVAPPPAPWQVMAWVDLDFQINSERSIW